MPEEIVDGTRVDSTDQLLQLSPATLTRIVDGVQDTVAGPGATIAVLRLSIRDADNGQIKFLPMLSVRDINIALVPQQVVYKQGECAYLIPVPVDRVMYQLELSRDDSAGRTAFEELLAYYVVFELSEMRNQAALVNRSTGEVMALLPGITAPSDTVLDTSAKNVPVVLDVADVKAVAGGQATSQPTSRLRYGVDVILAGSEAVSKTMLSQAEKLSGAIAKNAASMKEKVTPLAAPVVVGVSWKKKIKNMRSYTHAIATTTSFLARAILSAVERVAGTLGRAVGGSDSQATMSDTRYVLAKSLIAAGNILDGVEQSVRLVGAQSGQATVELVTHRYGAELGEVVADAVGAAGDLVVVYFDARGISRRALIKTSAKSALLSSKEAGGATA